MELIDDYGRHLHFEGVELLRESTDNPGKPQWLDITVWRTEAGQYVVLRRTHYRILHSSRNCIRAEQTGAYLTAARPEDTLRCRYCEGSGAWGQEPRTSVDVYRNPKELISGLATVNQVTRTVHHSALAQSVLADLSAVDNDVHAAWMVQTIA